MEEVFVEVEYPDTPHVNTGLTISRRGRSDKEIAIWMMHREHRDGMIYDNFDIMVNHKLMITRRITIELVYHDEN